MVWFDETLLAGRPCFWLKVIKFLVLPLLLGSGPKRVHFYQKVNHQILHNSMQYQRKVPSAQTHPHVFWDGVGRGLFDKCNLHIPTALATTTLARMPEYAHVNNYRGQHQPPLNCWGTGGPLSVTYGLYTWNLPKVPGDFYSLWLIGEAH